MLISYPRGLILSLGFVLFKLITTVNTICCVNIIACITYNVCNDNKEKILVYGLPKNGKLLECRSFEVGKPTKYLDLLKTAVDLLTEFYKNYLPRITYDYIGD